MSRPHRKGRVQRKAKAPADLLAHAQRRLLSRYGLTYTYDQIRALGEVIRDGKSIAIGTQSATRSWHIIELQDRALLAVYNRKIGEVTTFLEPEWIIHADEKLKALTPRGEQVMVAARLLSAGR